MKSDGHRLGSERFLSAHAINLLGSHASAEAAGVHRVDIEWTLHQRAVAKEANNNGS